MKNRERRFLPLNAGNIEIEKRTEGEGTRLTGYAAVFHNSADPGTEFELWEKFVERIAPGAFDRALREDDIRALFNHDPDNVLGRNKSGTLELTADSKGLRYDIDLPDTVLGKDLLVSIERKDITGSSFGFIVTDEDYSKEDGVRIRTIKGVRLFDVGPVTFPAYEATSVDSRALEEEFSKAELSESLPRINHERRERELQLLELNSKH